MLDVEEVWEDVSFASEGEEKSTSYTTAAGSVSHKLHMQITGDCVCNSAYTYNHTYNLSCAE